MWWTDQKEFCRNSKIYLQSCPVYQWFTKAHHIYKWRIINKLLLAKDQYYFVKTEINIV